MTYAYIYNYDNETAEMITHNVVIITSRLHVHVCHNYYQYIRVAHELKWWGGAWEGQCIGRGGGNTVTKLAFEKGGGGVHNPSSSCNSGAAPVNTPARSSKSLSNKNIASRPIGYIRSGSL